MNIVGIGCDLVAISRFELRADRIAKRILHPDEMACYHQLEGKRQIEYLAGRFAAKEAIIKALTYPVKMQSLIISYQHEKPYCQLDNFQCYLSIAHENAYAMAYAMCVEVS